MVPVAWSPDDKSILAKGFSRPSVFREHIEHVVVIDIMEGTIRDLSPPGGASNRPTSW